MAKIVEPPEGKHVKCSECGATIQYMPEDVGVYNGTDVGGGPSGSKHVKCPRRRCPGYGYIERW